MNYEFNFLFLFQIISFEGAPEVVAEYCTYGMNGSNIDAFCHLQTECLEKNNYFAENGERVLGVAFGFISYDENDKDSLCAENMPRNLCFFGLLSLIDPPRPGVAQAINDCHGGGIKVMMVTGDHRLTAIAIATKVNIITSKAIKYYADIRSDMQSKPKYTISYDKKAETKSFRCYMPKILTRTFNKEADWISKFFKKNLNFIGSIKNSMLPKKAEINAKIYKVEGAVVLEGKDIPNLEDDDWDYFLSHNEIVFARTTPQNKLLIVSQLQRRGEIVTVTGDGVNDAPALKKADIGIAMGIAGTEISKEAAQVVITDDNFATIVNGIRQGRLLFDNLRKVIAYLLPAGSFSEVIPIFAYVFFGIPLPLTTLQMMAICVGTDVIGSLGMVYEYEESDLMKRKPRNAATDHLASLPFVLKVYIQTGIIQSIIAFFMFFYTMNEQGVNTSHLIFAFEKFNLEDQYSNMYFNGTYDGSLVGYRFINGTYGNGSWSACFTKGQSENYINGSYNTSTFKFIKNITNGTLGNITFADSIFSAYFNGLYTNGTGFSDKLISGTFANGSFTASINNGTYIESVFGKNLADRNAALRISQTGFFVSLVMCQIINLFAVRTRFQSFFRHKFRPALILFALAEVSVVLLLCFIPAHDFLETSNAEWYQFVIPFLMGLSIFFIDEFKLFLIRKFPNSWVSKLAL